MYVNIDITPFEPITRESLGHNRLVLYRGLPPLSPLLLHLAPSKRVSQTRAMEQGPGLTAGLTRNVLAEGRLAGPQTGAQTEARPSHAGQG